VSTKVILPCTKNWGRRALAFTRVGGRFFVKLEAPRLKSALISRFGREEAFFVRFGIVTTEIDRGIGT